MNVFLPGLKRQINFLFKHYNERPKKILVIGSASDFMANNFSAKYNVSVDLIVDDYESLLNSKLAVLQSTKLRLMNFDSTDFDSSTFDLIYAQASISLTNRNKILKEISRIMKPDGYFCIGEIVALQKDIPSFVKNIFDSSDLLPLFINEIEKYYTDRNFIPLAKADFSDTLREYYTESESQLKQTLQKLRGNEKSYYKKLINKINHESNAYLKLGGDKYIGFVALLLQKGKN